MDLVFEEWQQSSAVERDYTYRETVAFFFETIRVLTIRQMGLEIFALFKEFTTFMLLRNLTISYFNYPLTFFINNISTKNALLLAQKVIIK